MIPLTYDCITALLSKQLYCNEATTIVMIMGLPTTTQEVEVQPTLLLVETLPILLPASRVILPAS